MKTGDLIIRTNPFGGDLMNDDFQLIMERVGMNEIVLVINASDTFIQILRKGRIANAKRYAFEVIP